MHVVSGAEFHKLPVIYPRLQPIIAGGSFASRAPLKAGVGSPASGVASFTIFDADKAAPVWELGAHSHELLAHASGRNAGDHFQHQGMALHRS